VRDGRDGRDEVRICVCGTIFTDLNRRSGNTKEKVVYAASAQDSNVTLQLNGT